MHLARGARALRSTLRAAWASLGPYLFVTGVFTFLYAFVPNTRVRFHAGARRRRHGGRALGRERRSCSRAWSRPRPTWSRSTRASRSSSRRCIWIYLSWLILLIGAQLSFYVQNPRYLRVGQGHVRLTSALRERLALHGHAADRAQVRRRRAALAAARAGARTSRCPGIALATVIRSLERAGLLTLDRGRGAASRRATSRASRSPTSCTRCATSGSTRPGSLARAHGAGRGRGREFVKTDAGADRRARARGDARLRTGRAARVTRPR